MNPIFIQMIYYAIVLILGISIVSFMQRGFFWKFVRVKTSLGRFILVKIRSIERDYHVIGHVEDNFLIFKTNKAQKRIALKNRKVFYRWLGCICIDIDSEKNTIIDPDSSVISGFDAEKFEHLYTRSLMRPSMNDNLQKIIIILCIVILLAVAFIGYMSYRQYNDIGVLKAGIEALNKGLITTTSTI